MDKKDNSLISDLVNQMLLGTAIVYFFRYAKEWDQKYAQENANDRSRVRATLT